MKKQIKSLLMMCGILFFSTHLAQAVQLLRDGKIIIPDKVTEPIKIDGILNENVWKFPPISREFITNYPLFGEKLDQQTSIWVAYDDRHLYFAFKCYETEPGKIKSSITKRDNTDRDDYMGVIIDGMGNRQTVYELYINPDGIQTDGITSAINPWSYDKSPDFVWESAGKKVEDGYQVEMSLPVQSIRFKNGKEVKMGIMFMRNISREGKMAAWPGMEAGQNEFNVLATVVYPGFKNVSKLEVLPDVVCSRNIERETGAWGDSVNSINIGASIKYGITPSITSEATINPDFSQVESDEFQVLVNQRYPVFYSEKRPFFMEGMDVLNFTLIPQGMMVSAVHTRRIIDPGWAAKLSGSSGKIAFNVLAADDSAPGSALEGETNPYEGKNAYWGIARAKYSLGSDNSLGILYSGRYFAGGKNNVLGTDFQYRFSKNARLKMSYLYSDTREPGQKEVRSGNGLNAIMEYYNRRIYTLAAYERYTRDFIMYSAFQDRTGIGRGLFYLGPYLYIDPQKIKWFRKIQPHIQFSRLYDLGTRMYDTNWWVGFDAYFTHGGVLKVEFRREKEAWLGRLYNQDYLYAVGEVQVFNWLYMKGSYRYGDQVYYMGPSLSKGHTLTLGVILQPGVKLALDIQYLHSTLSRESDHQKLYSVDILNLLATYQFNKYFFLRGAVRYDSYEEKLLTDFLASFTLIPGTVIHLGYGSLYEKKTWENNQWVPGRDRFLNMKNSLFFKVSYLWKIR